MPHVNEFQSAPMAIASVALGATASSLEASVVVIARGTASSGPTSTGAIPTTCAGSRWRLD